MAVATMIRQTNACLILGLSLLFTSCEDGGRRTGEDPDTTRRFDQEQLSDPAIATLLDIYFSQISGDFDRAVASTTALQQGIAGFLAAPDAASLDNCRRLWVIALADYEATVLHRQFLQQLASLDTAVVNIDLVLNQLQFRLNQWPILPGYIDYIEGYPDSGVVSDIGLPLTRTALIEQHGTFDLAEVLMGFHAVEFLLWGENRNEIPGSRPVQDFFPVQTLSQQQQADGMQLEELTANRRRQLLDLLGSSLLEDLQGIAGLWHSNQELFRRITESAGSTGAVRLLLQAMSASLTEEVLVRSLYPMLNGAFESAQQSVFSGTTANAMIAQLAGIETLLGSNIAPETAFDSLLEILVPGFIEFFYPSLDAGKECLSLLYSSAPGNPTDPRETVRREFENVECINLVINMTDALERVRQAIP